MSYNTADMHFHSEISDGGESIDALARMVGKLRYVTEEELRKQTGLGDLRELLKSLGGVGSVEALDFRVASGVNISRKIRTVCKLDHNTLLGTEEFISAIERHSPGTRVVVGAELTAVAELPHTGWRSFHVPVYFYDLDGFDMMERDEAGRRDFFRGIADDYLGLLNRLIVSNNSRYSESMRQRCNQHFFEGKEVITPDTLQRIAKEKVTGMLDESSVLNLGNNVQAITQNELIEALMRAGIREDESEMFRNYFNRGARLYVPSSPTDSTLTVAELLSELGDISSSSRIKVKRGAGHPATYVRLIARAMLKSKGIDPEFFHETEECYSAFRLYSEQVRSLVGRGLLDFVESEYPRYTLPVPAAAEKKSAMDYISYISRETGFAREQQKLWREFADENRIGTSGGSDAHFNGASGALACGFCDVALDDANIDRIFGR